MGGTSDGKGSEPPSGNTPKHERRQGRKGTIARRAAVSRAIGRLRLEEFHKMLGGLAVAVFGDQATVVAHLRTSSGREWVTFVVDAADPASVVQYQDFLPRDLGMIDQMAEFLFD